jgi:putative FmdB family regulatory protein
MPILEFKCPKCGKVFEILWREKEILTSYKCPGCGALSPRTFSKFNFQFSPFLKDLCGGTIMDYHDKVD